MSGKLTTAGPRRWLRIAGHFAVSPLTFFLAVRRSMTAASITLLLVMIVSLNIIWGYPWTGIFSATLTMIVGGFTLNWLARPRLAIDFSLPTSSPVGQPFLVTLHLRNESQIPAMDLSVQFFKTPYRRRPSVPPRFQSDDRRGLIDLVRPRSRCDTSLSTTGGQRGIQVIPDVCVESTFPFYLFRRRVTVASSTTIAITPQLIHADDDATVRRLLDAIGGWSNRLIGGNALDYTGSREYQVGMPVRRWDFASWARLGRPIVREFESPSIQMATIVVDTATIGIAKSSRHDVVDPVLERMLSLAAVAVTDLSRRQIRLRLFVTSESFDSFAAPQSVHPISDGEPLLIQLATAEPVSDGEADTRITEVLEFLGRTPTLILTTRSQHVARLNSKSSVTIIDCVPEDSPEIARHG